MKKPIKVAFLVEATVQRAKVPEAAKKLAELAEVGEVHGIDDGAVRFEQVTAIKVQNASDILGQEDGEA